MATGPSPEQGEGEGEGCVQHLGSPAPLVGPEESSQQKQKVPCETALAISGSQMTVFYV